MTEFKKIEVPNAKEIEPIELDFEEEVVEEVVEEVEKPKQEVEKPKSKPKKAPQVPKINQDLARRAQEAEEEVNFLREKLKEQEQTSKKTEKEAKEAMKATLEDSIETLNAQLVTAIEAGDAKQTVALQKKISESILELAKTRHEVENYQKVEKEVVEKPIKKVQNTSKNTPSQKAIDWVNAHPEFKTDPIFHGASRAVNDTLISEGYDPEDDSFWVELDSRLSTKFPEIFSNNEEQVLEEQDEGQEETAVVEKKAVKKPNTQQTVSGASRSNSSGNGKPAPINGKIKVNDFLTEQEKALADKWGMSYARFAERKLKTINKERGSYTQI